MTWLMFIAWCGVFAFGVVVLLLVLEYLERKFDE